MTEMVSVCLPLPHRHLSPNARVHWAKKARTVKAYRETAWALTLQAQGLSRKNWTEATAKATFYFPDKRRRDRDNLLAMLKPAFDGMTDADLLVDDAGLRHEPLEIGVDKNNPRVMIHVWPCEA